MAQVYDKVSSTPFGNEEEIDTEQDFLETLYILKKRGKGNKMRRKIKEEEMWLKMKAKKDQSKSLFVNRSKACIEMTISNWKDFA